MMIKLKGCPKCKGDVALDRDVHGWFEQCIQCGYLHDRVDIDRLVPGIQGMEKELIQVESGEQKSGLGNTDPSFTLAAGSLTKSV